MKEKGEKNSLNFGKRGLSPVIASMLLIALVIVLAAIIFLWARGFISEQVEKFGQPVEDLCNDLAFDVDLFEGQYGYELEIANRGNVEIYSFEIKEITGGSSEIQKFKFSVGEGESVKEAISLGFGLDKITIYPALLGNVKGKSSNKVFTCTEKGQTITL